LPGFHNVDVLTVRAASRTFLMQAMPDGYAIALCLPRHCFGVSRRAMAQAMRDLGREAGLALPETRAQVSWARVKIRTLPGSRLHRRPDAIWLDNGWCPITILGRYQARDLSHSELGYLARLPSGAEVFLVRESLGIWFIDNAGAL
jgi:hypothetical protein